jgi:hypothetical protein
MVENKLYRDADASDGSSGEGKLINAYKKLLRVAGCPEILIEHPELLSKKPTTEDFKWAENEIKKYLAKIESSPNPPN